MQGRRQLRANSLIPFEGRREEEDGRAKNDYLRATSRSAGRGLGASKSRYGYSFCASWKLPSDKFPRGARPSFEYAGAMPLTPLQEPPRSPTPPAPPPPIPFRDATAPEEFLIKDPNFIPYSKKSLYAHESRALRMVRWCPVREPFPAAS